MRDDPPPVAGIADAWGERLPRRLGLASAVAVIVGTTIGSGIFRTPAVVAERLDDPLAFAAAWVVGGVLALTGALSFAELGALFPRSGGLYVYIREAWGRPVAFLFGWAELLVIRPASYGAISIVSAEYLWRVMGRDGAVSAAGLPISRAQATAALLIALVAWVNVRGIDLGAIVQNVSTVLKLAALLALVVMGLALTPGAAPAAELPATGAPPDAPWGAVVSGFGLALVSVLWAYDGFADLGFAAGEVRDPERNVPRALALGTLIILVVYLLVNWIYVRTVPLSEMSGSPLIAADVALRLVGRAGVVFVTAAVAVSTFGTLNGSTMTGPRIFFAMAEDGLFFRGIAEVHPRHRTPARAIVMMAALGILFVSVRTFAELADQFIIGVWPFYALGVAALFALRRRPGLRRAYSVPGYPWVPAVFLAVSVALLVNYAVSEPLLFGIDLLVILAGWPVYLLWVRRR